MKNKDETFSSLMQQFGGHRDLRTVFMDFLRLCICAFSRNYATNLSFMEDEYLEIIGKYKKPTETNLFSQLLALLIVEMGHGGITHDVLGSFFEIQISSGRNGQYFTPTPICDLMASATGIENDIQGKKDPLRIIDPACGSGRMLLSKAKTQGKHHHFYGIDIDPICVQMTTLNLFLNGIFHAEVLQANALNPHDFMVSYVTSFVPFGIFRITERENSPLWNRLQETYRKDSSIPLEREFKIVSFETDRGKQISLF